MSDSTSRYVLLVSWPDGRRETHEIPQNGGPMRIGPRDEPAATPVDLYSPQTGARIGSLVVHGAERPQWMVAGQVAAQHWTELVASREAFGEGANGSGEPDTAPEWLAEFMAELAAGRLCSH
jgi:hypothetical protein